MNYSRIEWKDKQTTSQKTIPFKRTGIVVKITWLERCPITSARVSRGDHVREGIVCLFTWLIHSCLLQIDARPKEYCTSKVYTAVLLFVKKKPTKYLPRHMTKILRSPCASRRLSSFTIPSQRSTQAVVSTTATSPSLSLCLPLSNVQRDFSTYY